MVRVIESDYGGDSVYCSSRSVGLAAFGPVSQFCIHSGGCSITSTERTNND